MEASLGSTGEVFNKAGGKVRQSIRHLGDEFPSCSRGSRRSPGEGNGNPFQYSCLGNPVDRGAWRVHGLPRARHNLVTETRTLEGLI